MNYFSCLLLIFILFVSFQCITLKPHKGKHNSHRRHKKLEKNKKSRKFFFSTHSTEPEDVTSEDVTSEINNNKNKISYFINTNELPIYEEKFEKIKDLGAEIECKLRGTCPGVRREDIPDNFPQPDQENEQRQFLEVGDNQMHDRLPRFGGGGSNMPTELNQQLMPDMTAVQDPDSPFGSQRNAAAFGQQPQLDIKLPSKDVVDMQQSPTDNGRGEMMAQLASMPNGENRMSNTDADNRMSNTGADNRIDTATLLREQSLRNDEAIQNSVQSKINFMDQGSKLRSDENPGLQMQERNPGAPLDFMGRSQGRDSDSGPHGMPSSESSPVSDKDIMKAEGIAPNEMHDLHNFLKTSNEFHNDNQQEKFPSLDNPYSRSEGQRNIASSRADRNEDSFHDNPHRHHSRKFMSTNRKEEERVTPPELNFERPNVNFFSRGKDDTRESKFAMSQMKDRAMKTSFKPRMGENMPSMSNLLEGMPPPPMGAVGGGPSNPDYVEQTARQLMQSNSDYRLPGTTFTNLWKSFMLTTQSQLGPADPSANSREGFLGVSKNKESPRMHWKKSHVGRKHDSKFRRKKSSVDIFASKRYVIDHARSKRSHIHKNLSSGKHVPHKLNARLVYLPVSVLKTALSKAAEEIGARKMNLLRRKHNKTLTPQKEMNEKGYNRQIQSIKNMMQHNFDKVKNAKLPAFFITEKDGKRYLVLDPNQNIGNGFNGFPNSENQLMSFSFPSNANMLFSQQQLFNNRDNTQTHFGPIGQKNLFDDNLFRDQDNSQTFLKLGQAFKGFVAVPVVSNDDIIRNRMKNPVGLPMANFQLSQQFASPMNSVEMKSELQHYLHPVNADSIPNAFMYGPQFGQREESAGESIFEKISAAQPFFSGHFYRDPSYDPHESEDSFPDTKIKNGAHTNADEIIGGAINNPAPIQVQDRRPMFVTDNSRPPPFFGGAPKVNFQQDLNRNIALEAKSEGFDHLNANMANRLPTDDVQQFASQHPLFGAIPNPPLNSPFSPYPQSAPPQLSELQEQNEESEADPPTDERLAFGTAPQPLPLEEFRNDMKKHNVPGASEKPVAVFTKEHVGFGPITVEAKTANAPLTDPDDD